MGSGQVIQDLSASWLMLTLTEEPLPVALLQTALSLPILLLALPAGAVADIVDRRRWMIGLLLSLSLSAALLGVLAYSRVLTAPLLLGLIFLIGCQSACLSPAWMRTVPDLLTGPQIPWGVTLNSTGINLARFLGATIAAVFLGQLFPGFGFLLTSICFLAPALVLYRWQRETVSNSIAPESLPGAIEGGIRYAVYSPAVQRVALRTILFAMSASALLALLPSAARQLLHVNAAEFSMLWAAFGVGAVLGATLLIPLRARLALDDFLAAMSVLMALSMGLMATLTHYWLWLGLLVLAGAGWVGIVSSFGVAMGSVSPSWVLSRMLSLSLICLQGAAAVGSFLWGLVGQRLGPEQALAWSAALLAGTALLRWIAPMPDLHPASLAPARAWPAVDSAPVPPRAPVLVSIEYRVRPERELAFLEAIGKLRLARLRDGASQWYVFQSTEQPFRYAEWFLVDSWQEHLRQHERATLSDRAQQTVVNQFHEGPEPPVVRHWIGRAP